LKSFEDIYPKLDKGASFDSVASLLSGMSPTSKHGEESEEMLALTKVSLRDQLLGGMVGVSPLLVDELATSAVRTNYGQWTGGLHAFVGGVSLAGAQDGLWAVSGGNYKVAECGIRESGARLVRDTVTSVRSRPESPHFSLETQEGGEQELDVVVIAAPLTRDLANLKGDVVEGLEFPGHYHTTIATIVQGQLNHSVLGFSDADSCPQTHFFLSPSLAFASVAKLSPVDYRGPEDENLPPLYKVFSSRKLSEEEIHTLFTSVNMVEVVDWLAYPHYNTSSPADLSSFSLAPGVFYTSRIEWSASAMEMSALSARNVANLAREFWERRGQGQAHTTRASLEAGEEAQIHMPNTFKEEL